MVKKTKILIFSFGLSAVLVVGAMGFSGTSKANENGDMMSMMNGNGMINMMEAMNTPEEQKMMESCSTFMSSYQEKEQDK